jgi:tetratricopeptide (TPR) repeat protein/predicted Ser/Thr protein kinase
MLENMAPDTLAPATPPSEPQPPSSPADDSATVWAAPDANDPDALFQPTMVDRFVVIGELGQGAMGQVLRAYDPKLLREVAIKLVRVRDQAASARMLREAQALAQLNHPNVVSIYDVGEQQGTVFIAMEYVRGRTLRQWLDDERPDWRKTVELVQAAGRGLAAAHRVGLVHRDVKPDNILVADDGRVRVVDFGLARADPTASDSLDEADAAASWSELTGSDSLTRTGSTMGTLAYMAPEQHMGAVADARSDQYSLCVTLFELLYGRRPFSGSAEALCFGKLRRELEVPAVPRVPRVIVQAMLRGLSASPPDRWPSIDALLTELSKDPGRARRRAMIGIGGLAIAATAFGIHQLDRARTTAACVADGEAIAEVWNDEARAAVRAGLLATGSVAAEPTADQLMPWLDQYAERWQEGRTEACLAVEVRQTASVDVLERVQWCFEDRLTELEGFVAELTVADAQAVYLAVPAAASLTSIEPCRDAESWQRLPAPPVEQQGEVRAVRAALSRISALMHAGRSPRALELATETMQRAEALAWPPLVSATRLRLARALSRSIRFAEAEAAAEAAFVESATNGSWDVAAGAASLLVTTVGYELGRYGDGLRWSRLRGIAVANLGGNDELSEADFQYRLSIVLLAAGDLAAGLVAAQTALEIAQRRLGDDHPTTAAILVSLASIRETNGEFPAAKELYERALATREAALGPEHPDVGHSLIAMGTFELTVGNLGAARSSLERARAIFTKVQGPEHANVGVVLCTLGAVEFEAGDMPMAREHFERSVAILEQAVGPDHIEVARGLQELVAVHAITGNFEKARALQERALATAEKVLGPEHPGLEYYLDGAASIRAEMGDHTGAIELRMRALAVTDAVLGRDNAHSPPTLDNLGFDYIELRRYDEARAVFERSHAIKLRNFGPDYALHAISECGLGQVDLLQHQPEAAITHFERAAELTASGTFPTEFAEARFGLAKALWALQRDPTRALELARQAAEALRHPTLGDEERRSEVEAWLAEHARD